MAKLSDFLKKVSWLHMDCPKTAIHIKDVFFETK